MIDLITNIWFPESSMSIQKARAKNLSEQTLRDKIKNKERMQRCKYAMEPVINILREYFSEPKLKMNKMLKLAQAVSQEYFVKLDRRARRNKSTLICWFCENKLSLQHFVEHKGALQNETSNQDFFLSNFDSPAVDLSLLDGVEHVDV